MAIEAHGGTINYTTQAKIGTTFEIKLPLNRNELTKN
jgi:signal transduction histidine kinase